MDDSRGSSATQSPEVTNPADSAQEHEGLHDVGSVVEVCSVLPFIALPIAHFHISIPQSETEPGIGFTPNESSSSSGSPESQTKTWHFRRLSWTRTSFDRWVPADWRWESYIRGPRSTLHGDGVKTLGNAVSELPSLSCVSRVSGVHIPAEIVLQIVENVDGCEDVLRAKLCLAGLDSGDVFGSSCSMPLTSRTVTIRRVRVTLLAIT